MAFESRMESWRLRGSEAFSLKTPPQFARTRNLGKNGLGGVIFGCTNDTMRDCILKELFGLPAKHISYVQHIGPGLPLFLFNYSNRKLHGIFEATSHGQMNINPCGWTKNGSEKTRYPAQVHVHVRLQCRPLSEDQFRPVIAENYYSDRHFCFELDHTQTSTLMSLMMASGTFATTPPPNLANWGANIRSLSTLEMKGNILDSSNIESSMGKIEKQPDENKTNCKKDSANDHGNQEISEMQLNANVSLEVQNGLEQLNDGKLSASFEYQPDICAQLIRRIEDLENYKEQHSQKLCHMEKKLFDAEGEIKRLKDHYIMLECMSDFSIIPAEEKVIESSEELFLDSSEMFFLVGGYDGEKISPALDSFYPFQNVVKTLSPMNLPRVYASVAQLNDELYILGGGDGQVWYNTVESYRASNDHWVMCPSMDKKRGFLAGASLNNKLYAVGGGNGTECFSDVEMLDLDIGKWIYARSMLERRFGVAAAELNGVLYVTGGFDGTTYLRYALGGFDGGTIVSSTEIFDPRLGSWIMGEPMKCSRAYAATAIIKDTIYVIGGVEEGNKIVDTDEQFIEGQGWQERKSVLGKRCYSSAIVMH